VATDRAAAAGEVPAWPDRVEPRDLPVTTRVTATTVGAVHAGEGELAFTVTTGGAEKRIWVRTSLAVVPDADVALALSLIPAMVEGGRLEVEAPVDETVARHAAEIGTVLDLFHATADWSPARPIRHGIELRCPTAASPPRRPDRGVATFFSGGVDSFATLARHPEISHLIYVSGLDVPVGERFASHHERALGTARRIAEQLSRTLVTVETNARELYPGLEGPLYFGSILGATCRLVAPEIGLVYVPSSQSYRWMLENSSHPLIDHLWGGGGLEVVHDAAELTRPEKLELIADDDLVRRSLRVCWHGAADARGNCCRCEKCLRTMVALEALGVRGEFKAFDRPLDLDAVATLRLPVRHEVAYWRENLQFAIERGADPELIGAIESCLTLAEPKLRTAPARNRLPNPREGNETMLYCDPGTWTELCARDAVVFAVGSYDGSGNYGDIAQLQAAVELLDGLAERPLVLPVIELGLVLRHRELGLAATGGFDPERVLAFEPNREAADLAAQALGLVPMALPTTVERAVTYLYGGGYLNSTWGERKLSMAEAVGALVDRAGIAPHGLVCSGLQIAPDWTSPGGTRKRRLFARAGRVGVRDPLSLEAAAGLADEGGEPPAVLTGDDAVGVIPFATNPPRGDRPTVPLSLNVHFCDQEWVTGDSERQLEFVRRLLKGIAEAAGRPPGLQPLIAYDDARVSERPGLGRLLGALGEDGTVGPVAEPIVLRPARLAEQAEAIGDADLTIGFSYHVALTSLLAGAPAALLRGNAYYAQKAHGLRRDFALPGELLPTLDCDPAELAIRLHALVGEPAIASRLREGIRVGAERVVERRARAQAELATELREALAGTSGSPAHRPAASPTDRSYATLMSVHAEAVERARDLARLAELQRSQLGELQGSTSWRWTAPLRRLSELLRRRPPPG